MPAPTTAAEYLDLVRKSAVVDDKKLDQYLEQSQGERPLPAGPAQLAEVMVRDGLLTNFQAEQFLQGKWRRFSIGKYRILERLGSGGMGNVFLCEHTLMRRRVAVKVLPVARAADPASLERFYREARCVAALDHPNLVHAYDIGEDDKLHYLVLEYVDGASLQEIVRNIGPLDPVRTAHYIAQAALGLHHAFECAELVHRDVKPSNILVDRQGIVKVLDLGLARFFNDEEDVLTKKYDENVLGTADYLAPEQALDSHAVDIRADIYSLGATAYYCLTAQAPFNEGTVAQKLVWHQSRQPKPIRSIRSDVPPELIAVIDKMMAKAPDDRYATPHEVVEALGPWTKEPIAPPAEAEMPRLSLAASREGRAGGGGSSSKGAVPVVSTASPRTPPPNGTTPIRKPVAQAPQAATPVPRPASTADQLMPWPTATNRAERKSGGAVMLAPAAAGPRAAGRVAMAATASTSAADALPLWRRLLVAAGFVIIAAAIFLLGMLFFTGCSPGWTVKTGSGSDSSATSGPVLVVGKSSGCSTLKSTLELATPGTHVRIEGSKLEEIVALAPSARAPMTWDPPVVVEPAGDEPVTWTAPRSASGEDALLVLEGIRGLEFHNFVLDGQDRMEVGVEMMSLCPGVVLDKIRFRGFMKYELKATSIAGSAAHPIKLLDLDIVIKESRATPAFAFRYRKGYSTERTEQLVVHGCRFEGPFQASPVEVEGNIGNLDWKDNVWKNSGVEKTVKEPR